MNIQLGSPNGRRAPVIKLASPEALLFSFSSFFFHIITLFPQKKVWKHKKKPSGKVRVWFLRLLVGCWMRYGLNGHAFFSISLMLFSLGAVNEL